MLEAERSHGVRAYLIHEAWAAVLALRAASLAEYVCGFNLALADREHQDASGLAAETERRRPSGRKAHTAVESQALLDDAAGCLERAEAAESAALSAIGASDLAAAHFAVAHLIVVEAVSGSGAQEEWSTALDVTDRFRVMQRKRQRRFYVRGRAEQASQPPGGLLPLSRFNRDELGGAPLTRHTESGSPGTIASAVELIARWDLAGDLRASAEPSTAALEAIRAVRRGEHTNAGPGLAQAAVRDGGWDALDELEWEEGEGDETLLHIAEMRTRVSRCFEQFGRPVSPDTCRVYSERFHLSGYIDFVAEDAIWDLKVSGTAPSQVDVLQLLLYWATLRNDPEISIEIAHLGFYNPRLDTAWRIAVADIPRDVMGALESIAMSEHP